MTRGMTIASLPVRPARPLGTPSGDVSRKLRRQDAVGRRPGQAGEQRGNDQRPERVPPVAADQRPGPPHRLGPPPALHHQGLDADRQPSRVGAGRARQNVDRAIDRPEQAVGLDTNQSVVRWLAG
jgi:hypothetical protein